LSNSSQFECSGYKTFLNHIKGTCLDENNLALLKNYCLPLGEPIYQTYEIKN
jgi:hypothetical protein